MTLPLFPPLAPLLISDNDDQSVACMLVTIDPLSPNIHIRILQTGFHTFPYGISGENLLTDHSTFPLVVNQLILLTFSLVHVLILLGEN